jgi:hypothetical protein
MKKILENVAIKIIILFAAVRRNVVPQAIEPFNKYITDVFAYLNDSVVKARLRVSTANLDALAILMNDPTTGWIALHALHSASRTRTADVNTDLANCEITITHLLESMYRDMPRSAMLTADYSTLHIAKLSDTKPKRTKITNIPFAKMFSKGGAIVSFLTRPAHDSGRAHMDPLADQIEVRGVILKDGDPMPASPDDCNIIFVSKSAIFTHNFTVPDAGKRFACFLRYVNTTDEKKSGGFCSVIVCVIGL